MGYVTFSNFQKQTMLRFQKKGLCLTQLSERGRFSHLTPEKSWWDDFYSGFSTFKLLWNRALVVFTGSQPTRKWKQNYRCTYTRHVQSTSSWWARANGCTQFAPIPSCCGTTGYESIGAATSSWQHRIHRTFLPSWDTLYEICSGRQTWAPLHARLKHPVAIIELILNHPLYCVQHPVVVLKMSFFLFKRFFFFKLVR